MNVSVPYLNIQTPEVSKVSMKFSQCDGLSMRSNCAQAQLCSEQCECKLVGEWAGGDKGYEATGPNVSMPIV